MYNEIAVVAFILVIVGLLVAVAYADYQAKERLRLGGERVKGLITRNKFHLGRSSYFLPVVRFTTRAGVEVEVEYDRGVALAIPRYSVGTVVWVAYDKNNPRDFMLLTPGNII